MKLMITGSRHTNPRLLQLAHKAVVRAKANGWEILVGDAHGVDFQVIQSADHLEVPITVMGANNSLRHKTSFGENITVSGNYRERDNELLRQADVVLALWNGVSKGTIRNYQSARHRGLRCWLIQ